MIKIESGIVQYPVLNEKDEQVAVLVIDRNDNTIIDKLINLQKEIIEMDKSFTEKYDSVIDKSSKEITSEQMKEALSIYRDSINRMIEETEKLFGEGIVHDIYSINYQLNPDFLPSANALYALYDAFIPVVTSVIRENSSPKYSPANMGAKTTKSRKEIIKELRNE